jgi:hypothetical protein
MVILPLQQRTASPLRCITLLSSHSGHRSIKPRLSIRRCVSYPVDARNAVFDGEYDNVWEAINQRTPKIAADSAKRFRSFNNRLNSQLHIRSEAIPKSTGNRVVVLTCVVAQVNGNQGMVTRNPH